MQQVDKLKLSVSKWDKVIRGNVRYKTNNVLLHGNNVDDLKNNFKKFLLINEKVEVKDFDIVFE